MKTIKLLLLLFVATLSFVPAVHADDSLKPNEKQMLGLWQEYSPGSNCVEFFKDHTMRLYYANGMGRQPNDRHYLSGKWSMGSDNVMTYTVNLGAQSVQMEERVVFKDGELWMTAVNGVTTKHRRTDTLPAKFK